MNRLKRYLHLFGILIIYLFGCYSSVTAQNRITGIVTDAETQLPIEYALVNLVSGKEKKSINYTLTDQKGLFSLPYRQKEDSLFISVSLLGYKQIEQAVKDGEELTLQLEQQTFSLKEVEIRPGRVWGRQDTINYDVASFLSPNDESIKDVLRKLPGVDISELTGKISYNGKEISNFYVEGMELMGGRYKQLSGSLQALSVDKVQILDNHQPIRMLKEKVFSEKVALNIKLKPEFKDRWMGNIGGGSGFNEDNALWEGDANAIQISRNSQSAYFYKGNNTGNNIASEQKELTNTKKETTTEPDLSTFIPQQTMSAQLNDERILFNNTHSLSGNRVYKLSETMQLRLNAGYMRDSRKQDRGSETIYFSDKDSVRIKEETANSLRSDVTNLQATLENNADDYFLVNHLTFDGDFQEGRSIYSGTRNIYQKVKTRNTDIRNYLQSMWKKERYTLEVSSLLRYRQLPSFLTIDNEQQSVMLNHFYTEQSASFLKTHNQFTQRYTAGFTGEISSIKNGYSAFATPFYQWRNTQWRITSSLPIVWKKYPGTEFNKVLFSPSLSVNFKPHYNWQLSTSVGHKEYTGSLSDFYAEPYALDYKTNHIPYARLSLFKQQHYSFNTEYKDIIREFFSALSVNYSNTWTNQMTSRRIESGIITLSKDSKPSKEQNWNLYGNVSKGFFDLHLKTSLSLLFSSGNGSQFNDGKLLTYRQTLIQCEPKINWSPIAGMETSYTLLIRQIATQVEANAKEPLNNLSQKINIAYSWNNATVELITDHYLNTISQNNSLNTIFFDLNMKWKTGHWQFNVNAHNLFNKKRYAYSQYSALESYSSWINIRPREFTASISYRF